MTGNECLEIRNRCRLSVRQFADRLGISDKTVYSWEVGRKRITEPIQKLIKFTFPKIKINEIKIEGNRKSRKYDYIEDSDSKLYGIWRNIKDRCNNPNNRDYKYYGGKGIKLNKIWSNYLNFRAWSGKNGYKNGFTIHRIDKNKDYKPSNCRWVSKSTHSSLKSQ